MGALHLFDRETLSIKPMEQIEPTTGRIEDRVIQSRCFEVLH